MKFRYDKILGRNRLERLYIRFVILFSKNEKEEVAPEIYSYLPKLEYDISILIFLSIDAIRTLIGKPNYDNFLLGINTRDLDPIEIEPRRRDDDWEKKNFINNWYPQEKENPIFMEVHFNSKNRKVNFIFLGFKGKMKPEEKNLETLLIAGNLSFSNNSYVIKPLMAGIKKDILTGIEVFEREFYDKHQSGYI